MSDFQDQYNATLKAELADLDLPGKIKDSIALARKTTTFSEEEAAMYTKVTMQIGPAIFECGFSAGANYGMALMEKLYGVKEV